MSLGLCCQFMEPVVKSSGIQYINTVGEKTLQLGRFKANSYSKDLILKVYKDNLDGLFKTLKKIKGIGFKSFRISSNLLPLYDKIDESILYDDGVSAKLNDIGEYIKASNIRVSFHPDQWCVLASEKENVIENSIVSLKHHASLFDRMNLPVNRFFSINIHGSPKDKSSKLIEVINTLPDNVKNRLSLENDERAYSVKKLHEIFKETGVAICGDLHHHSFNTDGLSAKDALSLAISTWGTIKPNTHLSNSEPEFLTKGSFTEKRKHSKYYHSIPDFLIKLNNDGSIDIDMECKMKNIAILKAVQDFGIVL